jgi:hypothetical protein
MPFLSDINVPLQPHNDAIAYAKISPRMREIVGERAATAALLLQAMIAKRTGRLASSVHAHTEIGGVHHDMWVGVMTVGGIGAGGSVEYGLPHEYGRGDHDESIKNLDGKTIVQKGAHDLNRVLEELGSF